MCPPMSLDRGLTQGTLINGQEVGFWLLWAVWFETVDVCHCGLGPTNLQTHARTHARTHTRTHTYTHMNTDVLIKCGLHFAY